MAPYRELVDGKEIKRSLGTTDATLARRDLAALKDELRQIDRSQGRMTLAELADWQADSGREDQTKRCRSVAVPIPFWFGFTKSLPLVH